MMWYIVRKVSIMVGIVFVLMSLFQNSVFGELKLSPVKEKEEKMEEKSKLIEGIVERLQWGKGQENTFIGALTVALRTMGEDATYDYLMGISGASFRLHFHQPVWCPSSPDATCGFCHSEPALKALGYTAEFINSDKDKSEDVTKVRSAVVQSINNGHPVLAIDLINVADWGVIVGYADEGKEFLCRTYYDKTEGYSKAEKWPWVIMLIGKEGSVPARRESILRSLQIAVDLANTEKFDNYASGFSAYELWASDLLNDSMFEKANEDELKRLIHVNGWVYDSLVDARESAVKYLKSISGEFNEASAEHLSKATNYYEEVVKKLIDNWKYAPMSWQLESPQQWTKEMRHAEAGVLKEVLALERKAIDELKTVAMAEMGKVSAEKKVKK